MGLIAHLRNQFKSIKTFENRYDYIITFIRRGASYRPMGHIAHLIKQFKSINTYDYIITLIRRKTPLPAFENFMVLYLNKLLYKLFHNDLLLKKGQGPSIEQT